MKESCGNGQQHPLSILLLRLYIRDRGCCRGRRGSRRQRWRLIVGCGAAQGCLSDEQCPRQGRSCRRRVGWRALFAAIAGALVSARWPDCRGTLLSTDERRWFRTRESGSSCCSSRERRIGAEVIQTDRQRAGRESRWASSEQGGGRDREDKGAAGALRALSGRE